VRIVQILPALNEGGVERGTVDISREFVRHGHESIVISSGGKLVAQIESEGGKHITFDTASKNPLTAIWRVYKLRALLKKLNPSVMHARSRVPAWLAYLANKSLHIPFVTTVHGFNSVNPYSKVMTYGGRVVCVSTAIKEYVKEHYDVNDKKTVVIPRGIDLVEFNPANKDEEFISKFKQEYALCNSFVVTSVGRITQLKDYETFIKAVEIAKTTIPNIKGLIVGGVHPDKTIYFERLKSLVVELGLDETIIFAGSQSKIAQIYALSDIIVSASKKPESFGRSAAEALAMNRPVIATNHGGITDIVKDGKTGYLIPICDEAAMSKAIIKAADTKWVGLREFVEQNFTLEAMVNATLATYKDLMRQSFPKHPKL